MKLTPMKAIKYKFGTLDCTVNENGTITPHPVNTDLGDFVYRDEKHLVESWSKHLSKIGRKLIKVYENGLEVDITPIFEEKDDD